MHTAGIPLGAVWCLVPWAPQPPSETKEWVLSNKNIQSLTPNYVISVSSAPGLKTDTWITDIFLDLKIHRNVVTALPTVLSPAPESTQDHPKIKLCLRAVASSWGAVGHHEASLQSALFWAEQTKWSQLLPVPFVLQTFHHLCCPSLEAYSFITICMCVKNKMHSNKTKEQLQNNNKKVLKNIIRNIIWTEVKWEET